MSTVEEILIKFYFIIILIVTSLVAVEVRNASWQDVQGEKVLIKWKAALCLLSKPLSLKCYTCQRDGKKFLLKHAT